MEANAEAKEIIEANQSIETQIENWTLYKTKIDEAEAWLTKLAEAKKATDILVKNEVISASIKTLAEYTELERQAKEFISER
jgi:predicted transcriptional regulator